ncbi:hypothetical protein [Nodularia sp. NIES-3585]|uniref:hypothetical protein n=1 Tax=Nodularia sp. NIES-3585 TaxID=1973477 RepID=UPI000B5CF6B2|nr:hypothetical protein [Nodularia sp. NIES-3585]GAX37819.1 hypothetical protein NIES3585_38640 [Nodularia sp. NIES-3585]
MVQTNLSGDSITNQKMKGSFQVPANTEVGVPFKNETNNEVQIHFEASGQWQSGPANPVTGPEGLPDHLLENLQFPEFTPFSLIANNKDWGSAYQVGIQNELSVPAGGTLYFLMNDQTNLYHDNTGSITVDWAQK